MVSGEVELVVGVRMMLVLRRMYVVVEVVGKAIVAIEVVVCVLVMAESRIRRRIGTAVISFVGHGRLGAHVTT